SRTTLRKTCRNHRELPRIEDLRHNRAPSNVQIENESPRIDGFSSVRFDPVSTGGPLSRKKRECRDLLHWSSYTSPRRSYGKRHREADSCSIDWLGGLFYAVALWSRPR